MKSLPNAIFSGHYKEGHVQGIAVDAARGYVYYSFTTILLKTDLLGNPIGSVGNLVGHLGCIVYDADTDRVYGSLELKHDAIGQSILARIGRTLAEEDSFYLVSFAVDRIDRMGMDAERDAIMRAVYLADVCADYAATDEVSGVAHRYGCSGIDGVALGPAFGADADRSKKIMVAYGIYSDLSRSDNDHQVILQFDRSVIDRYALPLEQAKPHHNGPETSEKRYFFYTGNTTYGIQNLEYDAYSGNWFVAVYCGKKEGFVNFPMFVIDGSQQPSVEALTGREGEVGARLASAALGAEGSDPRIRGSFFAYGATGMASMGDGTFYFSHDGRIKEEKIFFSTLRKYRYTPDSAELFALVEEQ